MADPSKQTTDDLILENYTIRLSARQRRRVERAAEVESLRVGVRITPGTLFRDKAMEAIEGILTEQQAAAAS